MHTPMGMIWMAIMDSAALVRLMTWLSPAFPVGAFSYSHGLEQAVTSGLVSDRESLTEWLAALLSNGSAWNDCVLLAAALRAEDADEIAELANLAEALAGSCERHLETMAQGAAFIEAAAEWTGEPIARALPFPVAVGLVARRNGIEHLAVLSAFLHGFVSNQVQVALRLLPLGQKNGLWVLKALEQPVIEAATQAAMSSLDDLGSATIMVEICAMQHETMRSRIFRS